MTIKYSWTIDRMSVLQKPDPNFVVIVDYTCNGTDGTNSAEIGGRCEFASQDGPDYIPYADLTEEIVLGWVFEELGENGVDSAQQCVQGQINSIVNPPVSPEVEPLPWSADLAKAQ